LGREVAGTVKDQARGAAEELKSSVSDAASAVQQTAKGNSGS
jgi:uncharacterized protein YjbJ (UPF0337 family)